MSSKGCSRITEFASTMYETVNANLYRELLTGVDAGELRTTLEELEVTARECVRKTTPPDPVIAYSGGIDSAILAELVRIEFGKADLLTVGTGGSPDVVQARHDSLSRSRGFRIEVQEINKEDVENAAKQVSKIVSVDNLPHFEDCVSFWLAASAASTKNLNKFISSANGPDELFCGYDRFRRIVGTQGYEEANEEIKRSLIGAESLRKKVGEVLGHFGFESREPFLEKEFIDCGLSIPVELKIMKKEDLLRKRIWRCLGMKLGLPAGTVFRRKKAMQYGMGVHAVVQKMISKGLILLDSKKVKQSIESY